jgi:hypothetical protein
MSAGLGLPSQPKEPVSLDTRGSSLSLSAKLYCLTGEALFK